MYRILEKLPRLNIKHNDILPIKTKRRTLTYNTVPWIRNNQDPYQYNPHTTLTLIKTKTIEIETINNPYKYTIKNKLNKT